VVLSPGVVADEAVGEALLRAESHHELVRSRVAMMGGYADTTGCLRQFLLGYFGEHLMEPCGRCDTCASGTVASRPGSSGAFSVHEPVRHEEWGAGTVIAVEEDRVTVLFDEVGYRTLSTELVEEHDLLRRADAVTGGAGSCPPVR
jgi:ATP-dependent DNA helicase RecQ